MKVVKLKEESVVSILTEYGIPNRVFRNSSEGGMYIDNVYKLEGVLLKRTCPFAEGDLIRLSVEERTTVTNTPILSTIQYRLNSYDDYALVFNQDHGMVTDAPHLEPVTD